jgi:SAM-dependent methyltransferase
LNEQPQTWHYGLVAKWWAEFNIDGPEIDYYRRFIEKNGEPALDVGCGNGRLLLPWVRTGLDVDGCDISPDMIHLCRERAEREHLAPTLFVQAMHELSPPRRYRTIVVCGAFGLGSTHLQDLESLRRFHRYLQPGGRLLLDIEVPYSDDRRWQYWLKGGRLHLPEEWGPRPPSRRGSDGADYWLSARVVDFDRLEQCFDYEMLAEMWRDGQKVAEEKHGLTMRLYFRDEVALMLAHVGFSDVQVRGNYTDDEATGEHDTLVFIATRGRATRKRD